MIQLIAAVNDLAGLSASQVIEALDKGAAKDREKWDNGQVSKASTVCEMRNQHCY